MLEYWHKVHKDKILIFLNLITMVMKSIKVILINTKIKNCIMFIFRKTRYNSEINGILQSEH